MTGTTLGWSLAGWLFGTGSDGDRGRDQPPTETTEKGETLAPVVHADASILARIRANDEEAFAELYQTYYAAAVRFACRYIRAKDTAEDVVQDVFTAMWERRSTLEVDGSILAYLLAGVRRRAFHLLRHDRVIARTQIADLGDPQSPLGMGAATRPSDAAAAEAMLVAAFHRILQTLPERQRAALVLRGEHGLSNREIARVLNVGEAAVSRLLTRAIEAFRGLV